ncbi:dTMP kinase [Natranaerobius trueperi]|nr:dTMP kinase [Natranaerobius trueperi]
MMCFKTGKFITFEGIDGCGKSTQLLYFKEYLNKQGEDVITTREPGGTNVGDAIRSILLDRKYSDMTMEAEALLYAASRVQHVTQVILPNASAGKVVLCDRFIDSSIAYQGGGDPLTSQDVRNINSLTLDKIRPDITFLIDIDPEQAFKRLNRGRDRIENRGLQYQEKVRKNYLKIASKEPDRIIIIDGNRSKDEVFWDICDQFKRASEVD